MQTRKQSRWLMPVVLLMLFGPIIWVSATFIVMGRKAEALDAGCNRNFEQLSRAFQTYAKQHNGKLPNARDWADDLKPYLGSTPPLHCPADSSHARSSYAMNMHLSGKRLSDIHSSDSVVLLYETRQAGANPAGSGKDVVDVGRDTKGRHYRTANRYNFYLTADLKIHRAGSKAELEKLQWDVAAKP